MTDSQNAYNPDKTQPLASSPAAAAVVPPSPPAADTPVAEKNAPSAKSAPAQMDLLKSPPPPAPTENKQPAHEKTQPLHALPPAPPPLESTKAPAPHPSASTSQAGAKEAPKPPEIPPPQKDAVRMTRAESTKAPATNSDAPKSAATSASEAPKATAPPRAEKEEYVKTVKTDAVSSPDELVRTTKPTTPIRDRVRWLGHKIASTELVTEILPGAAAKMRAYAALTRLDKPIGIWLLMWPVLWALWLASNGRPDPHVFVVFVLGTLLTRSAGCAINDFADRNFDGHVKRTKDRPLVTGAVDPAEAVAICAGLGLIALGLVLTLNQLTQIMALIGGVLVITYPFFKRFFPIPQMYLGIAFTWSVPMAYAAQTGTLPRIAWVLFMSGLLWTVAYDTMYAMVDREDDKKLGVRSSAILFGDADRFIVGVMQLMTLLGLWLIGDEMELGFWYGLGLAGAAVFALYQQFLIRQRKPEDCFRAFLNNNYFGMSVFIGILLEYTFR